MLQIPRTARRHNQRYPHVLTPAHWVVVDRQEGPWDRGGGASPPSRTGNRTDPGATSAKGGSAMRITSALPVGWSARVSTDRQAEAQTVDSQVAALRERIARDAPGTPRRFAFIDEGYSATTLVRPALERLRDLAAGGGIELRSVQSPDRLART